MTKASYITLLFLLITIPCKTQHIKTGIQVGLGNYSMAGLKELNENALITTPFETELVHDFPAYFYYRPFILLKLKKISFGPVFTFQSTGSRISARDYSGEYLLDMVVSSNGPGIYDEIVLFDHNYIHYSFYSTFGTLFSNLKMKESLIVNDESLTDEKYKFKSFNYYLEAGLNISYSHNFLDFGFSAGFQIQAGDGSFRYSENKDTKLINTENYNPVRPGWNGFRAGLSVSYCFPKSSEKQINP